MNAIKIIGGVPLIGEVEISGSKNAVLPLIVSSLLTSETVKLSNVPFLADITTMVNLLIYLGVNIDVNYISKQASSGKTIALNASDVINFTAPYNIVSKMRASFLVMGPILARFGHVKVSLPGGCAIGSRPIDIHLDAFALMGAEIKIEEGYIYADAPNGLHGAEINFSMASVGATENIVMAATLASGITIINNAAREPEIVDLCNILRQMGAKIEGDGTSCIKITGVKKLQGTEYYSMPDRIEAGTYAIAAAITKGEVLLKNISMSLIGNIKNELTEAGISLKQVSNGILVKRDSVNLNPLNISTMVYPGFSTDMQAQFMALMTVANGVSAITENIFENRFMHAAELNRLGANIQLQGNKSVITGVKSLKGAYVMATDLRASVSLVIAALIAEGETVIQRIYHLDRGYEYLEHKLLGCGANIQRINI
jgi:UDP-N-acetylglucosamine 1-carboxyvinyltransferase